LHDLAALAASTLTFAVAGTKSDILLLITMD
jgi:hypothetical protein